LLSIATIAARIKKIRSQSQAGMAGASDMRVKLTCVNDSRRFRAQHYVLGREAAGLFPSGSVFEEGTAQ
jgi:hypothetical protein